MKELVAAIDLGSNTFRLQIGRIINDQIYPLDGLKESVGLAVGLSAGKMLDEKAQLRALGALARFRERLAGFSPDAVRAVGTNTLRVAKNAPAFLKRAEAALGFPIEVIAGREEARLIYIGVVHTLPDPHCQQLVVDIGGGSTELIVGKGFEPLVMESTYMGCVGYSQRYFPGGRVDKRSLREAEIAGQRELQSIAQRYRDVGWERAVGSSGSAKALVDILEQNNLSSGGITREGLERLKALLVKAGNVGWAELAGLKGDRVPVLMGGLAIMSAIFNEFELEQMMFAEGALRLGVLYDLLGRYHHHDLREATVNAYATRYGVDMPHALKVAKTACHFLEQVEPAAQSPDYADRRFLYWAAVLHEIGISVAHSGYHKHSAYVLANADMPGFSRGDQERLARIVLGHRGGLNKLAVIDPNSADWLLIVCLRLAVVIHRARDRRGTPPVSLVRRGGDFSLIVPVGWLDTLPLTAAALREEQLQWKAIHRTLEICELNDGACPAAKAG